MDDDDTLDTDSVVDDTGAGWLVEVTDGDDTSVIGESSELAGDPQAVKAKAKAATMAAPGCLFVVCFMGNVLSDVARSWMDRLFSEQREGPPLRDRDRHVESRINNFETGDR